MTHEELEAARLRLSLPQRAGLAEIRARYRELVKQHHPDRAQHSEDQAIHAINQAYQTLRAYCDGYAFSFSREEFLEQNPEERLRAQFAYDPVWGGREPGNK